MDEMPAEAEEIFQYELIKSMKKLNRTLEQINSNLEAIKKKLTEEEGLHP